jgi:diguanylate cyclase (GGDEF)-like protein
MAMTARLLFRSSQYLLRPLFTRSGRRRLARRRRQDPTSCAAGTERRDATLESVREENARLHRALRDLTREAEKNEAVSRRFHALELALLDAPRLPELVDRIVGETPKRLALDEVTLLLTDPEHEIRYLLGHQMPTLVESPAVRFCDRVVPGDGDPAGLKGPWTGPYRKKYAYLFRRGDKLGSVALLPLCADGRLFGTLNLASSDPERYTPHHASDFHRHLANITSLCLQNAINREKLEVSGNTDVLTGWHNRRHLETRLPEEMARAIRYSEPLCCLILDIDHFKQINDVYGHLAGDDILREVARQIKLELRGSDLAARYGGEEFVVFLSQTSGDDAERVAERVRRRIASTAFDTGRGVSLDVTLSGGISELRRIECPRSPAGLGRELLQRADAALYRAKASGRNRIVRHEAGQTG